MRKNLVLIVITLISGQLLSQNLPKNLQQAKWQQKVAYSIVVSLDDKKQLLNGFETIQYTNNSPNELTEIFMHLWPNGYRNRNTAFAKQHLENGNTDFYFSTPEQKGWIDSLQFKVNGTNIKWQLTNDIDIAKLVLNQTLMPGQSIEISTPFVVKIPDIFSRMGHDDGLYCITQWYPKPAVYDVNGWNPIPYLDQGEFYSEFGSFDVKITIPKDYVVAATGLIQNAGEKNWWLNRSVDASIVHPSAETTKTLHFLQDSVHDFAWFCSKDFKVAHSEVILNNGKKVDTWLFSKTQNKEGKLIGTEYIDEAIKFYSDKVGNYPYELAQVVITPLKAGGGMEYPTITNCQSIDKTTIVHEVGHNWFYGILASNERNYPWMDESFNTYYETRNKNEGIKKKSGIKATTQKRGFSINFSDLDQLKMLFEYTSRKNKDQAGNLNSVEYTDNNYGAIIYSKNPLGMAYLQHYLGDMVFDSMMQAYFEKWKFKHPLPDDFKTHAQQFTGKDLNWFFDGVLGSTQKLDYKIEKVKKGSITVKNNGSLIAPLAISRINSKNEIETNWQEGFVGTKTFEIKTLSFSKNVKDSFNYMIDGDFQTIDLYPQNNIYKKKGIFKTGAPLSFQPLGNTENPKLNQVFWLPAYAYNVYNKSMLGLLFYNSLFPQKKNEFIVMPTYSFSTKDVNGYAQYWHHFYPLGKIRDIQVGFKSARFANQGILYSSKDTSIQKYIVQEGGHYTAEGNLKTTYEKIAPFISFSIKPKKERTEIEQIIMLRYVMINEQETGSGYFKNFGSAHYGTGELSYTYKNPAVLYPMSFGINYQYGVKNSVINRLCAELKQGFLYKDGKKSVDIRLFAGTFLGTTNSNNLRAADYTAKSMFMAGGTLGYNDYFYDQAMFGRSEGDPNNSFFAHQVIQRDAGFRNMVRLGNTDKWISAANITIPAPIPVPIGIYADASFANIKSQNQNGSFNYEKQFFYAGGVYLQIVKDIAYWYVPFFSSSNVETAWNSQFMDNAFKRSTFVLNLNKINPISLIRNLKF